MPNEQAEPDPLLWLADELRDLGGRLADVADALVVRTATPADTATESATEPAVESAVEPVVESTIAPVVAPVVAEVVAPVAVVEPTPIVDIPVISEPVAEAYPEPVVEAAPEPPAQATPETFVEADAALDPAWDSWLYPESSAEVPAESPPAGAMPSAWVGPPPETWLSPETGLSPVLVPPIRALPVGEDRESTSVPWERWGSRSLAWIGGAVTLLGIVLLLVLAIQRGWLGPLPRLLVGLGVGAALLGIGWRVHRTPSGLVGAFALTATGIAALYLDVLAATALYHYLPVAAGLFAGLAVATGGLLLASRWNSPALAIFVVLAAAACAPLITHGVTPLLVSFLLVLAGAATPVQLRRHWRWLGVAADGPPLVASLILDRLSVGAPEPTVAATAVVALVAVLACLSLAVVTVLRAADDPVAIGLVVAAPTPMMAAAPLLPQLYSVASLVVVSVLLFGIWAVNRLRSRPLPAGFAAVAGAAGTVTLFQAVATATAGNLAVFTITVLCQSILLAVTAFRTRGRGALSAAAIYGTVGLVAALVRPLPLTLLALDPMGPADPSTLRAGLTVAVLVLVTAVVITAAAQRLGLGRPAVWWPLGVVGLYGFSGTLLCASMLVAPDQLGFLVGQVLVTVGWAGCALVLLARGISALPARMAGLALIAAALVKLITFDLATLDGVTRVAAFLGCGVVVLTAGVRYGRAVARRSGNSATE